MTPRNLKVLRSSSLWPLPVEDLARKGHSVFKQVDFVNQEFNLQDIVLGSFDLIELGWSDFKQLTPLLQRADAMVQQLNWSDAILFQNGELKPILLHERVFAEVLTEKKMNLRRDFAASLVGGLATLASFVNVIHKLGYNTIRFFCSPRERLEAEALVQRIKRTYLSLKIEIFNVEEITEIDGLSSLIVVDLDLERQRDLFELLSYFNFMTPQSLFLDLREPNFDQLRQEAEKAELICLSGEHFWSQRYKLARKLTGLSI